MPQTLLLPNGRPHTVYPLCLSLDTDLGLCTDQNLQEKQQTLIRELGIGPIQNIKA